MHVSCWKCMHLHKKKQKLIISNEKHFNNFSTVFHTFLFKIIEVMHIISVYVPVNYCTNNVCIWLSEQNIRYINNGKCLKSLYNIALKHANLNTNFKRKQIILTVKYFCLKASVMTLSCTCTYITTVYTHCSFIYWEI